MHQNAFGGRAVPGPAGGAYSAPPGPLGGLKGKEREGEWERGKGRGIQRHPQWVRRRKIRPTNPQSDKNKEVGGTKFKFGQLIFWKIIKIVATRCHILRLKCTKFDFGWGSQRSPKPSSWI